MSAYRLRPLATVSFATLALLAAACSMEATDGSPDEANVDQTSEELSKSGVFGAGPIATVGPLNPGPVNPGPTTPLPSQKAPRVMTRSVAGSTITVGFDRVVTPTELPTSAMHVDVVRRSGTSFQKSNVLQSATLAADGKSLTMHLTENVRPGTAYYTRGQWKRCRPIPIFGTTICNTFRAEFGEIVVSRVRPVIVNGALLTDLSAVTAKAMFFNALPTNGQPRVMHVAADEPTTMAFAPAPGANAGPGTFRVKSVSPVDLSEQNTRDLRSVVIEFEGGQLDCSATPLDQSTFQLYSRSPDIAVQQLMFHDPAGQDPSNPFSYRGTLRCEESNNRLVFTTPGRLFGDVQYLIEAHAKSKEGDTADFQSDFYTERPGLRVYATKVENDYGSHDTCDSDGWFGGDNYCDIYVTSAIATSNASQTGRIPDSGDFSEMRYFPTDAVNGIRYMNPPKVLFASPDPSGVALTADFLAYDADSTSAWKKVLEVAGKIATEAGAAVAAVEPEVGAISAAVGAGLTTISDAIPTNEDDKLGTGGFQFTREDNRWGTTSPTEIVVPVTNNAPNRGPVKVYIRTEEWPAPWRLQGPIL